MDQGATSMCVAYSGQQFLSCNPVRNKRYPSTEKLYLRCQQNDEWPGEGYDGTSVRALFKILTEDQYVSEYRWAFDVMTVVRHVLGVGPVVFGTNWYSGMMDDDKYGFIRPSGYVVGGHAYLVKGVNLDIDCRDGTKGALRIINSWGKSWAQGGYAWISLQDAARLITEFGEAATSTEQKPVEDTKRLDRAA